MCNVPRLDSLCTSSLTQFTLIACEWTSINDEQKEWRSIYVLECNLISYSTFSSAVNSHWLISLYFFFSLYWRCFIGLLLIFIDIIDNLSIEQNNAWMGENCKKKNFFFWHPKRHQIHCLVQIYHIITDTVVILKFMMLVSCRKWRFILWKERLWVKCVKTKQYSRG